MAGDPVSLVHAFLHDARAALGDAYGIDQLCPRLGANTTAEDSFRRLATFSKRTRHAALARELGLPLYVDRMLIVIDSLTEQIALADKELRELATHDPTCKALMTIPGIGPVTAMRFVAAIDDVTRFPSAHAVQAFLGLTPGENSSADRRRRTGITKAGPPGVRRALVQGASSLRRTRPQHPISLWAKQIEERAGSSSQPSPSRASSPA